MPFISIIIPVFNVEQYLRRCLDSVLSQTFANYECILIDDCSPDKCPAICDEYVSKDSRFKIIHKHINEGVAEARKSGQKLVTSEFVTSLDSDDWLDPCALEILCNKQHETNADIVIGSFKQYFQDKTREIVFDDYIITDKQKMLSDFFLKRFKNVWGKLYRSSLFAHITQPSNLTVGEDIIINVQVLCSNNCNIVAVIKDIVYNYDTSTGGVSQGYVIKKEKAVNFFESHIFVRNFLIEHQNFNFRIRKCFYHYLFIGVYTKMFHSIPKREVQMLLKQSTFPYVYFPVNVKSVLRCILNWLFLVNDNLYKSILDIFKNIRKNFKI